MNALAKKCPAQGPPLGGRAGSPRGSAATEARRGERSGGGTVPHIPLMSTMDHIYFPTHLLSGGGPWPLILPATLGAQLWAPTELSLFLK